MPLAEPLSTPKVSDFFSTPEKDSYAIARIIRLEETDPYAYVFYSHGIPGRIFDPPKRAQSIPVYCLGTPKEDTEELDGIFDAKGLRECSSLGPIGESGTFLHDYNVDTMFSCFLLVHEYAGVTLNSVQVWNRRQGSESMGVYADVRRVCAMAEARGAEIHDNLFSITGTAVPQNKAYITCSIDNIGEASGNYSKYKLTSGMVEEAKERMRELKNLVVPYRSAMQIEEYLGVSGEVTKVERFESGTDGPPKMGELE